MKDAIELKNITALDDAGFTLLDDVDMKLPLSQSIAVTGMAGSGKEALGLLFARQVVLKNGSVTAGSDDLLAIPETVAGRTLAYAGPEAYFFPVDIKENLLYGLRVTAPQAAAGDRRVREAIRAGNPTYDADADWLDYDALGTTDPKQIADRIIDTLTMVGLENDVYNFGLQSRLDPKSNAETATRIVEARLELHKRLRAPDVAHLVESFDPAVYNKNASLAENILFGASTDPLLQPDTLPKLDHFRRVVAEEGLEEHLVVMGRTVADTMLELFRDFPADHPFFEEFSFIPASELPLYEQVMKRARAGALTYADRALLAGLPLRYVEARHRLDLITPEIRERILAVRRTFAETLPKDLAPRISFYDEKSYNTAANLLDNILLGRVAYGVAQAQERVGRLIREVLDQLDVRDLIIEAGLAFNVGAGGKRLTTTQRQKLSLGRAIIKEPNILIVNSALANLDDQQKTEVVDRVLAHRKGRTTLWVLTKEDLSTRFDRILHFDHGRLVADRLSRDLRDAAQ